MNPKQQPPYWADKLLQWFCAPRLHEEVQGDLHELYGKWVAEMGEQQARKRYVLAVLGFLRPFALKQNPNLKPSPPYIAMLKNYLTIALRNLQRQKTATIINIAGLGIGISACLVIYIIVSFELGFDTYHPGHDRIYRVYSQFSGAFEATNRGVPAAMPDLIRKEFTGIETLTAFHTFSAKVSVPNAGEETKIFKDNKIIIADTDYFKVFETYEWLAGNPDKALAEPFRVVLTESKAKTYFGKMDPREVLGRTLQYADSLTVSVAGIVRDLPAPTDFVFTDFISLSTIRHSWLKNNINLADWNSTNGSSQLFIRLVKGTDMRKITAQLSRANAVYKENNKEGDWQVQYHLQALRNLHVNTKLGIFNNRGREPANLPTLRALGIIALLVLLIAAINFINLVTAQAVKRAKEVGVRKVLGSTRRQLVGQFLSETFLITTFAVLMSILLAQLALLFFIEFLPEGVALDLADPSLWLFLLTTIIVVSFLAGLYPAFVLSSFAPVRVLKNQTRIPGQTRTASVRKGLIVFQFSFAQLMIVGTLIIGWQLDYMINKDMGFQKDAVVYFDVPFTAPKEQHFILKQQLLTMPQISSISMHSEPPASGTWSTSIFEFDTGKELLKLDVHKKFADTAYIHLYNIPLLAGRNIMHSDTLREFIINETCARQLGFPSPEQAIGQVLGFADRHYPIVGVMADFHVQSLHENIPPVALANDTDLFYSFSLKLATKGRGARELNATIKNIEALYHERYPDSNFEYTFLDETIAKFYESEQRTGKLMVAATGIAIFISCLGLFGLITYAATQRTKEIGIRKVLGASVTQIVSLLSKDFLKLVLIANSIAWPIAYYALNNWLENFVYRISVNGWVFALAGLAALVIAILTMSVKAIKAASANPVDSLRNE